MPSYLLVLKQTLVDQTANSKMATYENGKGLDGTQEMLQIACEIGLISKAGAWYNCDFMGEDAKKFQGQDKLHQFLKENPDTLKELEKQVKEMLCVQ